jgi:chromosome segregation ATPase
MQRGESGEQTEEPTEMTFNECMDEAERISMAVEGVIHGCEGINIDLATDGELRRLQQSLNVLDRKLNLLEEFANTCQIRARAKDGPVDTARSEQIELYAQLETAKGEEIQEINERIGALSDTETRIKNKLIAARRAIEKARSFQAQTASRIKKVMDRGREEEIIISLPQFG